MVLILTSAGWIPKNVRMGIDWEESIIYSKKLILFPDSMAKNWEKKRFLIHRSQNRPSPNLYRPGTRTGTVPLGCCDKLPDVAVRF